MENSPPLTPYGFQESNSGSQAWPQVLLPTEPCHQQHPPPPPPPKSQDSISYSPDWPHTPNGDINHQSSALTPPRKSWGFTGVCHYIWVYIVLGMGVMALYTLEKHSTNSDTFSACSRTSQSKKSSKGPLLSGDQLSMCSLLLKISGVDHRSLTLRRGLHESLCGTEVQFAMFMPLCESLPLLHHCVNPQSLVT